MARRSIDRGCQRISIDIFQGIMLLLRCFLQVNEFAAGASRKPGTTHGTTTATQAKHIFTAQNVTGYRTSSINLVFDLSHSFQEDRRTPLHQLEQWEAR
jgi:hypothetical protein